MITLHRIGVSVTLAAALGLGGCAKLQSDVVHGWMATFAPIPKLQAHASHRHQTQDLRTTAKAVDPEVTGSATPIAQESALATCNRRLYLQTATSTEDIRVAEEACKQLIVSQPYGAGAN